MTAIEKILSRLRGVRRVGDGKWRAQCHVHDSTSLSLALMEKQGVVYIHCHGGCETGAVLGGIGLTLRDLYDAPLGHSRERVRRPWNAYDVLDVVRAETAVVAIVAADLAERRSINAADWARLAQASSRLARLDKLVRQ